MRRRYEVWFDTFDPVTMRYNGVRAQRVFDRKTEAEDYVEDIKRGWVKTVVDQYGKEIDLGHVLYIRLSEDWC